MTMMMMMKLNNFIILSNLLHVTRPAIPLYILSYVLN